MEEDTKLTPEEIKALRNLLIWFVVKIGAYFAIRWAINQAYRRHLEEQGIDPNDPDAYIKMMAKTRAQRVASNN